MTERPAATPSPSLGRPRLDDFDLAPDLLHCNQGSFGAVPRVVQAAQDRWRRRLNANPTGFLLDEYPILIRQAADRVAEFLGGEGHDWVFVDNATTAVATVLASLNLKPGDRLLTTSHAYNAVKKALAHGAARWGAEIVIVPVFCPMAGPEDILNPVGQALRDGPVRAAFFDHVASPSGVLFPVAELARLCRDHGVPIFVDGAHGPGMVTLDVPSLGVDWYTGNGHKWLFAPPGCGLLWCRRDRQADLPPLVISHGIDNGWTNAHDWVGTRDPSIWLSVGAAIDYHRRHPDLMERNHRVAVEAGEILAAELDTTTVAPSVMLGSMTTIRLPGQTPGDWSTAMELMLRIQRQHKAVAVFSALDDRMWLRLSASIYNELEDLLTVGRLAMGIGDNAEPVR